MSESQSGRLYRAIGAPEEPNTIIALPNRKSSVAKEVLIKSKKIKQERSELVDKLSADPDAKTGLSAVMVFAITIGATVLSAIVESLLFQSIDNLTRLIFIASVLYASLKSSPADSWAGWTSAPFAISAAILVNVNLTGMDLGGWLLTQPLGLLVGLSEHMWILLATAAASWVIGRRHQVAYMRAKRRAAKSRN
jgi:hypothetical protein